MLTTNPPVPLLRSISGRLYAAIGVLCVALLATNAETIIYSGTVAAGANAVEQESIDAMRAVDGFDELLDQYRRAVTVNSDALPSNARRRRPGWMRSSCGWRRYRQNSARRTCTPRQ
jgi:hypothetical protein